MSPRIFYSSLAIACTALLSFGYFLQFVKGIEPCPLCIFQRVAFIAVILFGMIGAIHGPRGFGRLIYSGLICIAGLTGAGIAARQVWLQHLPPDQVPACGPGLEFMFDTFPIADAIKMVFRGSGECAEVKWTFLSLSIPEWSLIWFTVIVIASGIHLFIRQKLLHQRGDGAVLVDDLLGKVLA